MNKSILFVVFALIAACNSATVDQVVRGGSCATVNVKGLSQQLIEQINCLSPGTMKSIKDEDGFTFGASVFPYLQGPAANKLVAAVANSGATLSVNSALRTLPQQYLLYKWANMGLCGITAAAAPGRSNHNGGLAVDVNSYSTWINKLKPYGWVWYGNGDKVHFTYKGSGAIDIRELSIKSFQMLWNLNNPDDIITVDGDFGPNTERRLKASPATGFEQSGCKASRDFDEQINNGTFKRSEKRESYGSCTTRNDVQGQCIPTSECTGTTYSGLCPGPNNIKCCVVSFTPTPGPAPTPTPSTGGDLKINQNGVLLIQSFEGYYANFYKDPVGIRTIGYGHACTVSDCNNLQAKDANGNFRQVRAPLSRTDASDLLRGDIDNLGFEDCVNKYVTRNINSDQFSSLISFAFNLGCGAFGKSTLLKRVNAGAALEGTSGIRAAFMMWNKAGGKVLPGLTRRRNAEANLYGGKLTTNSRDLQERDITFDPNGSGVGSECWHYGEKGVCIPNAYCTGFSVAGLCPGAADIQCCLRKKCDATSEGSQDGQCGLATSCVGKVIETANCTGSSDLQCCQGSFPQPTTKCPDGATWSTTLRWCQTDDKQYALGPFTRNMVSKCSSSGAGDEICVQKYPYTWNGESILLFRWPMDLATRLRGTDDCMLGSKQDNNYLGYCVESVSMPSATNDTVIVSQRNVYGAMPAEVQEACTQYSGGLACVTPRYDGDFFKTIAQSFHLSIIPTDEDGNTEDNTSSSLDTNSNIWVNSQWMLSAEHEQPMNEDVSGAQRSIIACIATIVAVMVFMF